MPDHPPLKTYTEYVSESTCDTGWVDLFYADAKAKGYRYVARKYRPAYVEGFENDADIAAFDEYDQVFDVPFIAQWKDERFERFEVRTESYRVEKYIMVHLKDKRGPWLAGFLVDLNDILSPAPT